LHRLTSHQARPTTPGSETNGNGDQTHRFSFVQPKRSEKQRKRSGTQREPTRSHGKQLSSDFALMRAIYID